MPPKKKKTLKTPPKPKPSTPSSTAAAITPPPDPPITVHSTASTASTASNDPHPPTDPQPETQTNLNKTLALELNNSSETLEKPCAKTVLRVRKVVKKKIVKKLVPKGSVAANPNSVLESGAQEDVKVENIVEGKDDDGKVKKVVRKKIVKKLVPKGSLGLKKVDVEKNLEFDSCVENKVEEDEKVELGESEVVVKIEEDCGVVLEKDENLEGLESGKGEKLEKGENLEGLESGKGEKLEKDENLEGLESGKGEKLEKGENLESGKDGERLEGLEVRDGGMVGLSERMKKRKAEIFIGGLDRDAKEEDIRSVFGKVGEILELRMMMDGQTGRNKGYAFLRYVEPSQAKRAVAEFSKVEV